MPAVGAVTARAAWSSLPMLKVWSTGVAAFQLSSPAWEAVMVQLPAPVRVTSSARTVQAPVAAKPTARGEVVVALTANGGSPTVLGSSGPKVMAWSALPIVRLPSTKLKV